MSIDLIIFDCDGVLVDSEAIYIAAELEFLAGAGLRLDRAAYMQDFMGLSQDTWQQRLETLMLKRTSRPLPTRLFQELSAFTKAALEERLTALPSAHQQIEAIGHPCCVASSIGLSRLTWKLERTGLLDLFSPHVFSAEMVENGKPSPDLFLHAAACVGVDPSTCIVVEDSANGVRAGKAAGMRVIGLTAGNHCDEGHDLLLEAHGADRVVANYEFLCPTIAALARA